MLVLPGMLCAIFIAAFLRESATLAESPERLRKAVSGLRSADASQQRLAMTVLSDLSQSEWAEVREAVTSVATSEENSPEVRNLAVSILMNYLHEPTSSDKIVLAEAGSLATVSLWGKLARSHLDPDVDAIGALRDSLVSDDSIRVVVALMAAKEIREKSAPLLPELVTLFAEGGEAVQAGVYGVLNTMPKELAPYHDDLIEALLQARKPLIRMMTANLISGTTLPAESPKPTIALGVEALSASSYDMRVVGAWVMWRNGFPGPHRERTVTVLDDALEGAPFLTRVNAEFLREEYRYTCEEPSESRPVRRVGGRRGRIRKLDSPEMADFCNSVAGVLRYEPERSDLSELLSRAWRRLDPKADAPSDTRLGEWSRFVPSWVASIDAHRDRHTIIDETLARTIADEGVDPFLRRAAIRAVAVRERPATTLIEALLAAARSRNASVRLLSVELIGDYDRFEVLPEIMSSWRVLDRVVAEELSEPASDTKGSWRDFVDGFAITAPEDTEQRDEWKQRIMKLVDATLTEDRLRAAHRSAIGATRQEWTVRRSELNEIDRLRLAPGGTLEHRRYPTAIGDAVSAASSDAVRDRLSRGSSRLANVPHDLDLLDRPSVEALFGVDEPTVLIAALRYAARTRESTIEWLPTIVDRFLGDTRRPWPVCLEAARLVTQAEGEAVPALAASLDAKNPTSRILACLTLGEIGGAARSAIPKLEALAANADEIGAVRRAATTARERIESAR